jgi:hypothetical protein
MDKLEQLLGLLTDPSALVISAVGILCFVLAPRHQWVRWALLGAVIFAASLYKFQDQWVQEPPPFIEPIQRMVDLGRPITIIGLVALLALSPLNTDRRNPIPAFIFWLALANLVLSLKVLAYGSMSFAFLTTICIVLLATVFTKISNKWIGGLHDTESVFFAMSVAAILFCVINILQYVIDPAPLFVSNERLNGTTGNPQHAAAFLSGTLPAILYFMTVRQGLIRFAYVLLATTCFVLIFLTGSRTGFVMAALSTVVILRSSSSLRVYVIGVIGLASLYGLETFFSQESLSRLTFMDTRSYIWAGMWQDFMNYPLFGAPIRGERLGFGESSWLAMAATGGVVGLIPLLAFGVSLVAICVSLVIRPFADRIDRIRRDTVLACIGCLLLGSFAEAYLLAILGAPVMLIMLAGATGLGLLKRRTVPPPTWKPGQVPRTSFQAIR